MHALCITSRTVFASHAHFNVSASYNLFLHTSVIVLIAAAAGLRLYIWASCPHLSWGRSRVLLCHTPAGSETGSYDCRLSGPTTRTCQLRGGKLSERLTKNNRGRIEREDLRWIVLCNATGSEERGQRATMGAERRKRMWKHEVMETEEMVGKGIQTGWQIEQHTHKWLTSSGL